jgi:hypothetical protein
MRYEDAGAVLLLALMFMALTSLIVIALVSFSGNDIKNVGHFTSARTATYAADGAIQAAIYSARYSYETSNSGSFCGPNQPPNPFALPPPSGTPPTLPANATQIYVWCSWGGASVNRISTFSAYVASQCHSLTSPCSGNPYLKAQVAFNDLDSGGNFHCTSSSDNASCGFGMTILSWTVLPVPNGA